PAAPPAPPPDVRNNLHPFEGRVYVLVLDGLHTSATRSLLVRAAAHRFLQRNFAEGDLAAVVHTSGGATLGQELTDNRQRLLASVDRFMGRRLSSATLSRIDEYRRTQDTLRALADETSGFAAVNTNDFGNAFARVVKDNSAYYVLGYYPAGHPKDGRFHKLQVKVSRPDLKVRARSGYSTPRGKASRETPTVGGRDTPALLAE